MKYMDFGNNSSSYDQYHHHHHNQQQQNGSDDTQLNQSNNQIMIEKEHMFDKVVTPSDVGKLNRLVIPKQHAGKYFPLDSSSNEKGLLLNFEDRIGKPWRFRYSYWNSSQSYVMTKGWSRFVKDKKLDAGDIVSFHRGVGEFFKDRLFIDWRRRVVLPEMNNSLSFHYHHHGRSIIPWNPMFLRPPPSNNIISAPPIMTLQQQEEEYDQEYDEQQRHIRDEQAAGNIIDPTTIVLESSSTIPINIAAEKEAKPSLIRLFGVNMECGVSSEFIVNKGKSSSLDFDDI